MSCFVQLISLGSCSGFGGIPFAGAALVRCPWPCPIGNIFPLCPFPGHLPTAHYPCLKDKWTHCQPICFLPWSQSDPLYRPILLLEAKMSLWWHCSSWVSGGVWVLLTARWAHQEQEGGGNTPSMAQTLWILPDVGAEMPGCLWTRVVTVASNSWSPYAHLLFSHTFSAVANEIKKQLSNFWFN